MSTPFRSGWLALLVMILPASQTAHAFSQQDLNKLLKTKSCTRCDLAGAPLDHKNLAGVDLSGADLSFAYVRESDLSRARLTDANLAWANLSEAKLKDANLRGANLDFTTLTGADLTGATLYNAKSFDDATTLRTRFCKTEMPHGFVDNSGCT